MNNRVFNTALLFSTGTEQDNREQSGNIIMEFAGNNYYICVKWKYNFAGKTCLLKFGI